MSSVVLPETGAIVHEHRTFAQSGMFKVELREEVQETALQAPRQAGGSC